KIASMEITDIPLISYTASKQKPMIISTGVADADDIGLAVETCRQAGNRQITLLKCTSQYPARIEDANLTCIPDMKQRFGVDVGVSDHSPGSMVPVVAVALGAVVVEKHFILDRKLGGPDSAFSMEPHEFAEMVQAVRQAEAALGRVSYDITNNDKLRRRSLFVVRDIAAGELLSPENIRSIRPGAGLHPKYYDEVIGKRAIRYICKGKALDIRDFE
ncbi:MAG TPA: N-acetylneuraminate synthase family protein, partial [Bacteroidales bacterium]|nr:N-acetylneuraminate synthase family protein [Bacteroidales bacterium]